MKSEVKDSNIRKWFDIYQNMTNPFIYLTTKIDVTNIINYCKIHKNYYITIAYFILKTANSLDCFKYRMEDNKIYKYDTLKSSSVELLDNDEIIYVICKYDSYKNYLLKYKKEKEKCIEKRELVKSPDQGVIWFSCVPWYNTTSLITPYSKDITIPQFAWDKYVQENGRYYINLTIMIHHGFAGGKAINNFLNILEDNINNYKKIIEEVS